MLLEAALAKLAKVLAAPADGPAAPLLVSSGHSCCSTPPITSIAR